MCLTGSQIHADEILSRGELMQKDEQDVLQPMTLSPLSPLGVVPNCLLPYQPCLWATTPVVGF